jgi:hypothetical protein
MLSEAEYVGGKPGLHLSIDDGVRASNAGRDSLRVAGYRTCSLSRSRRHQTEEREKAQHAGWFGTNTALPQNLPSMA